jgi:hypothetical protein
MVDKAIARMRPETKILNNTTCTKDNYQPRRADQDYLVLVAERHKTHRAPESLEAGPDFGLGN